MKFNSRYFDINQVLGNTNIPFNYKGKKNGKKSYARKLIADKRLAEKKNRIKAKEKSTKGKGFFGRKGRVE